MFNKQLKKETLILNDDYGMEAAHKRIFAQPLPFLIATAIVLDLMALATLFFGIFGSLEILKQTLDIFCFMKFI